ncbi:MAG: hypothetical protein K2H63_00290 [Paramuribaculum sp.]|nr:hypothetical protein [Paramuribaculum sp.]
MMTEEENINSMQSVKRSLITARDEISSIADFMEARLTTESDRAMSKEYGRVCRVLGIMEEQITQISNQLTKLK